MLNSIIKYFLNTKLLSYILLSALVFWGISIAPFNWELGALPSDPVPVDAIPDIGENQQIVFSKWPGRSPQDIEDQITYPLSTYLLGIPGVKSVRSSSIFGFSNIYIIFSEEVEFYWSRSRILEKLNSLPADLLPEGVQPALGPDATALGQVFWYTLEGRDSAGNTTGGWDLQEIRSVQDYYLKYSLSSAEGVSEIASIGGFVKEYQVDVNPEALQAYNIPLHKVMRAVQESNRDVGAKTLEINQAEYLVRGLGYIEKIEDLEEAVVAVQNNVPIHIKDIAKVSLGPAGRRGLLDKDGAEVVGAVAVARFGANPLEVIQNLKSKIKEIAPGLPKKTLADGRESQLTIVPFYDRSELIYETLGTLEEALSLELLITLLVVIVMVYNLRASLLISSLLPIAVLMVFIAMKYFDISANIVALSGIAIAIGTMVDLGIILSENILKHLDEAPASQSLKDSIYKGASEVSGAILTAVLTTIVSFIPVFTMQAAEGKLFSPLAYTKTFALIAALLVSLLILPTLAQLFLGFRIRNKYLKASLLATLSLIGLLRLIFVPAWIPLLLMLYGIIGLIRMYIQAREKKTSAVWTFILHKADLILALITVVGLLAQYWLPLGPSHSWALNFLFVALVLSAILGTFYLLETNYKTILNWCLNHKVRFLLIPALALFMGANIWLGFDRVFSPISLGVEKLGFDISETGIWQKIDGWFPGIEKEFMPPLDEGSFLLMPTSMPHSGIAYNRKIVGQLDQLLSTIPEVDLAVGKLGRVESALDPAPISMFENIINYKPEFMLDTKGHRQAFKIDAEGNYLTKSGESLSPEEIRARDLNAKDLVADPNGVYLRNWRDKIQSPDDIWDEIVTQSSIPGITSAPKLQPIQTRLVMLQTGMRAPMGIKVYGPDLQSIQDFGLKLESILKKVSSVKKEAVFADRIVGKPYLQLRINRNAIARYGLSVQAVQQAIETAIGGIKLGATVEGRERYPIRMRYPRELRDDPESLSKILITSANGAQIPLGQLVDFEYQKGPQAIKSEESFLVGYVLFDKAEGHSEVSVVEDARQAIEGQIERGELQVPAGISYKFSGSYENQVRAEKRLSLIVPLVLVIVFLILYFQFHSVSTSLMVFSGIAMAFSGGFIMIWLYGQGWFANFELLGVNFRDLFQMHSLNLSVAVWVGFIALFGIATDDGVLIATYLDQSFKRNKPSTQLEVRQAVLEAGQRRIKPALMTVSTTLIALLPVLSSTGRGSDIMIPMAIPSFGGMAFALISIFIVPVLYSYREERKIQKSQS
ncbi:efflux RND transporter permease subunit [Croceimicrobium hydrocarbonivorans]|uniref:Efflux RND transporter permease subunit n=1 Tax=Croceimicrobium hydrocarbonivorans TaxID=2761580 RepID=A0A7H0VES0_9FLAO|nr:efflux RND transporter permease subunit [Croceimicrobium hydrocarbonivorans]QNR24218.1 efflux RND transporter permease subunit [Croceimicrobium hydrocarbonivorans]